MWALCRVLLICAAIPFASNAAAQPDVAHGRYVFSISGCAGCHTTKADAKTKTIAAGGRALKTPFGSFYSPNITPDKETGIGSWSLQDFRRALKQGRAPDGTPYFPAFPFTSYTGMTNADISDLWAYMKTMPALSRPNRAHDVAVPFRWRVSAWGWQMLFFTPSNSAPQNRGAYLVNTLGHCGECHTPRNILGVLESDRHLAGTDAGPHGGIVPNITPDKETGLGKWSRGDFKALFTIGMLPDADFVGGGMADVVDHGTSVWTDADRAAAIQYLQSVPLIYNKLKTKKKPSTGDDEWN